MTGSSSKTVGVIGGMGPLATVDFLARLISATPAERDQDHIHVIIDHDPTIPNRHESIAGTGPDVTPWLTAMATRLETAGADFLVMACNTAHAYEDEIRAAVSIPLLGIADTSMEYLARHHPGQVIGLVATEGCLAANVYQDSLEEAGFSALWPEGGQLDKLMHAVFEIKAGHRGPEVTQDILAVVNDLIFSGAEVIVSACTELPLVLSSDLVAVPLVDPTETLVQACVAISRGERSLN